MTEIEKIDNRLNVIDAKMAALKEGYDHAANQRLHYEGRCETFIDTLNTLRNEYNLLEHEKKKLCDTNLMRSNF